jgi:laminin alpha 3/5
MCTVCNCDSGTSDGICDKKNGTCICAPNFQGERCSECAQGFYNFPNCLRNYLKLYQI